MSTQINTNTTSCPSAVSNNCPMVASNNDATKPTTPDVAVENSPSNKDFATAAADEWQSAPAAAAAAPPAPSAAAHKEATTAEDVDEEVECFSSFDDMGLPEDLLRGIYSYGFEKPSAIQSKAIAPFIKGRDIIAQSQSGTGKTGAFTISVLSKLKLDLKAPQVIILSPTRELAEQTDRVVREIGHNLKISTALCIGGSDPGQNMRDLAAGAQVIIGTGGRVYDMMMRRANSRNANSQSCLDTKNVSMLVLDEADEMLSQDFTEQVYNIFTKLPTTVQVALYSATLSKDVLALSKQFMRNPLRLLIKNEELTLEGIRQFYINVERDDWKFDALLDLYKTITIAQTILYVNTRRRCEWLTNKLGQYGYSVAMIHGSMSGDERRGILKKFRLGEDRILISTDLLARGIDIQQISLVVNYDLPADMSSYIHRSGRCGRYGRKGVTINFCTDRDVSKIEELQSFYRTQIDWLPKDLASLL